MIDQIDNPRQALLYLTDCALATVGDIAISGKKINKFEYERHILIAQTAIDLLMKFNIEIGVYTRIYEVVVLNKKSVKEWAKSHYE